MNCCGVFFKTSKKAFKRSVFKGLRTLVEMPRCCNLSENGVINGVVKFGRKRQISYRNGVETHVLAGRRVHGFFESIKILKFRKRR